MILQSFLQQLSQFPARTEVVGLAGSASAYLLAQLWQRHPRRPFCVLTPTPTDAARVAADLAFFTPSAWRSRIYPFPAPEITLYHPVPRGPDVVAGRLRALTALHNRDPEEPLICVAPIAALSHPTLPPACHRQADRVLRLRETIALHELREWLIGVGYIDMPLVEEIGTIAVRGGLIDCWPPTESFPVRIELDGEVIASLRAFDPATQRSLGTLDRVNMGPAAELRLTPAMRTRALAQLRARADTAGLPASARRPLLDAIQQGRRVPLCDTLLPIFYDTPGYLTDYLPGETVVVICDPLAVAATADALATRTMSAWEEAEPIAKLLSPEEALRPGRECLAACAAHPCIYFGLESIETQVSLNVGIESTARLRGSLPPAGPDQDPLTPLAETLRQAQSDGYRLHIICHTEIAAARTVDLFRWHGLALQTEVGALSAGFRWPDERLCYLTEAELFGTKIARRPTKRPPVETFLNFHELAVGDHVVHEEHGIGRFLGLVTMPIGEIPNDYVTLEYLGGDKLYLPVYRLHLLQRYIGTGDGAPLVDRLGGTRFLKATQKALRSIRLMANDLLKIYAERRLHPGTAFSGRDQTMEEFESAFPYDETPDQWEAIEETLRDMQRDRPMDRLICGDVGYGKTEVAMRAAFRAAMDGKQVAVLTPTTLLAFQHYQTFSGRFAATPIRVAMVSRFLPHKEIGQVLADAAHGTVDILIGTHRLLQRDVTLPRLGLLVIDEEQHFGVAHKERLRKLRATVDTLTMTATPIPRTLHMAFSGIRDISIIQTPPADRQAIQTFVIPFDDGLIRDAMRREFERGGEVFFVHNRVQTILAMRDHLQRLVPEARIVVAHGQMEERALERAMRTFVGKEANCLLCTSIIESGLDIPAANTILINRADTFGLSQLYQIRGRVGRSNVQAVCYLLTPPEVALPTAAQQRLATLARLTELGSGFSIAMHDLEQRGAGNLLGAEQSGHIAAIGYEMFTKLLEQTMRRCKGEAEPTAVDPEITLPVPASLPEGYLADPQQRLVWYKRLATMEDSTELDAAAAELQDRFGVLPESARHLFRIISIKQAAKALGVDLVRYDKGTFIFRFHAQTPVDPGRLMAYVDRHKETHALRPNGILAIRHPCTEPAALCDAALDYLRRMTEWNR